MAILRRSYHSSFSAFPVWSLGFTIFGEIFVYVALFYSNHRGSHIPSSWLVHAGCVFCCCFFADIHLSMTWMSGSFESHQRNACVHRLDLSLYSRPAYPKILLSILQTAFVRIFRFLTRFFCVQIHHQSVKTKQCQRSIFLLFIL